jgi:NADPH:quinone reductase-like Zn-dependent oxidoreductase
MLALLSKQPGGLEVLALEKAPEPKPDEVMVAVRACGLNDA